MFFSGTLQEGIGQAIQNKKPVVCFIHNDDGESASWARDYLQPLGEILQDHAVVLKIQKDSTEAGYLGAICDVESAPMVVVIFNGQVKGQLRPPVTVDDFRRQLLTAMDLSFRMSSPAPGSGAVEASSPSQQPPVSSQLGSETTNAVSSSAHADALADRRRRMAENEAVEERRKQEAAETRRQAARDPNSNEAYQAKLAEEKKKQRQAAADEKKRVLDLIEADKQERRKQTALRAAEREAQKQQSKDLPEVTDEPLPQASRSRTAGPGGRCRLQLRLWDGRTERADFMALQSLASVKEWIEDNIEPNAGPYTLREVIGIGAARPLDVGDEKETLAALGLTPSATLIVRPVVNAISSGVDGQGRSSILGPPILLLFNLISGFLMAIWAALTGSGRADHQDSRPLERTELEGDGVTAKVSGIQLPKAKIQTLDDRRKKDKPTLYNGNQLGVIPNEPDDDDDDKNDLSNQ